MVSRLNWMTHCISILILADNVSISRTASTPFGIVSEVPSTMRKVVDRRRDVLYGSNAICQFVLVADHRSMPSDSKVTPPREILQGLFAYA